MGAFQTIADICTFLTHITKYSDFPRKFDWKKLEVQITNINHCHLIDHEEQLYPIILSHCQHSLKAGHGQEVHYDFQGLEKHILKRFIFGKPTILLDIPQVGKITTAIAITA